MKRQWGIGVGAASILIIFVLLCLTTFATLSFVSARADLRLSQRAADTTAAYYEADGEACALFCALTGAAKTAAAPEPLAAALPGLLGDRLFFSEQDADALALGYRVAIDEVRAIEVTLRFAFLDGQPSCAVEGWRIVQTGGWAGEEATLALWQGGLAGMPALEE